MNFTEEQIIALLSRAHEAGQRSTGNDAVVKSAKDYAKLIVLNVDTEKRVAISCSTCKYQLPYGRCSHPQGCEGDYELWEQEIT